MGSPLLPIPGAASYGNPTGQASNPVFDANTSNNLKNLVPGIAPNAAQTVGSAGANPFIPTSGAPVPVNPISPVSPPNTPGVADLTKSTPVVSPTGNPNTWQNPRQPPTAGVPGAGTTQFGFTNNTPGVTAPNLPTASPQMIASWDKQFGSGSGAMISGFLNSLPGATTQATNAFLQELQPFYQQNMNQLMETMGISGNRQSSAAGLAAGELTAQYSAQQSQIVAQMTQWAYQSYLQAITGFQTKNQKSSPMNTVKNILGLVGTGADIAGNIGGVDPNGKLGQVLGGLAGL